MHISCHLKVRVKDSCVRILRAAFFSEIKAMTWAFGTRAVTVQRMDLGIINYVPLPDCASKYETSDEPKNPNSTCAVTAMGVTR